MKIKINDKEYTKFTSYNVSDDYNAIGGSFSFNGLGKDSKEFIYKYVEIYNDNDELIMAGKVTDINTSEEPTPTEPNIQGYGEAGILEDVVASKDSYPLERNNYNIEDSIRKFWGEYGIGYAVHQSDLQSSLKPFEKITIGNDEIIKEALNNLVLQRGLFLSHMPNGSPLLVGKPLEAAKVYDIERYIENFSESIKGRNIHSKIHVLLQADTDNDGKIFTIENDFVTEKRERLVIMKDGNIKDMEGFAKKLKAQEMLNITCSFNCPKFVPVGNIIIKNSVRWFITNWSINGDASGETISYNGVLEETYKI